MDAMREMNFASTHVARSRHAWGHRRATPPPEHFSVADVSQLVLEEVEFHRKLKEVTASMDGNINTLFTNLATTIRNVSVAVGVFAFMWGAIQYATSGGSPHQLEQDKSAMKASVIGVGAVVLATTFVGIVFTALSAGGAHAP